MVGIRIETSHVHSFTIHNPQVGSYPSSRQSNSEDHTFRNVHLIAHGILPVHIVHEVRMSDDTFTDQRVGKTTYQSMID